MARIAPALIVLVCLVAAPAANAAVEGALAELTGPGSCLTETAATTVDCTALPGSPSEDLLPGDIRAPDFSPDGRHAYLAAARPSKEFFAGPALLYVLDRDPATGRLSPTSGTGTCFSEAGRAPCPRARNIAGLTHVHVSGDGRFVYGGSTAGLAVFRRNAASGALTQLPGRRGCVNRLGSDGCTRARGMTFGSPMTATSDDRHLLVQKGATIYILGRDARTGALNWPGAPRGCVSSRRESRCADIPDVGDLPVFSRNGRVGYAPAAFVDGIVVFRRDPASGRFAAVGGPVCARRSARSSPRRCGTASGGSQLLTLSPDERHLYLGDTVLDEVVAFSTERPRAPRAVAGTFGCSRGSDDPICRDETIGGRVEITPDGRFAYQIVGGLVLAFARDPGSGALQLLPSPDGCLSDRGKSGCTPMQKLIEPWRSRLSPDGRQLYVGSLVRSGDLDNRLVVFAR